MALSAKMAEMYAKAEVDPPSDVEEEFSDAEGDAAWEEEVGNLHREEEEATKKLQKKPKSAREIIKEAEDEEAEDEEAEEGDEPPMPSVKVKEPPTIRVPEAPKEKPLSKQEFYQRQLQAWQIETLRQNGLPETNASNLEENLNRFKPLDLHKIIEFSRERAAADAQAYEQEKIIPYQQDLTRHNVSRFMNDMLQEFPDMIDYTAGMDQVANELVDNPRFAWLRNDPLRAIPFLYLKAKERKLRKAFVGVRKAATSQALEKGAARLPKGASNRRGKEEAEMDRAFGLNEPKNVLSKIFDS